MKKFTLLLLSLGLAMRVALAADGAAYTKEIETWRAQRVARLTTPDGWLTLIGLHF